MRPFLPYYGGKWMAGLRYPSPIHDTLVEPFAGGAGYAVRHAARRVVLVEKDERIAAIWQYLIAVSASEMRALPAVIHDTHGLDVCEEARNLIGFWLNPGSSTPKRSPGLWMRESAERGGRLGTYWGEGVRNRLAWQLQRIRHWRVIHGDYTDAPEGPATWFVDPPYQGAGKYYRCHRVDYAALGAWCRARVGQTIVCENEGANWLPFEAFGEWNSAQNKPTKEVVWLSGRQTTQMSLFNS